jgi:HSP20 family molecular chaperone IbpA
MYNDRFGIMPQIFPSTGIDELFSEFDKVMKSLPKTNTYPTNIYYIMDKETQTPITVGIEIAAAGLDVDASDIEVNGNVLNVTLNMCSEFNLDEEESEAEKIEVKYIQKQIARRSSKMSWTLSDAVDTDSIVTDYYNGILTIEMSIKKPEVKTKKIKIFSERD